MHLFHLHDDLHLQNRAFPSLPNDALKSAPEVWGKPQNRFSGCTGEKGGSSIPQAETFMLNELFAFTTLDAHHLCLYASLSAKQRAEEKSRPYFYSGQLASLGQRLREWQYNYRWHLSFIVIEGGECHPLLTQITAIKVYGQSLPPLEKDVWKELEKGLQMSGMFLRWGCVWSCLWLLLLHTE